MIREWEEDFVRLSDGDPRLEKELRKMDMISFLNRILVLKKKQMAQERIDNDSDPFGRN